MYLAIRFSLSDVSGDQQTFLHVKQVFLTTSSLHISPAKGQQYFEMYLSWHLTARREVVDVSGNQQYQPAHVLSIKLGPPVYVLSLRSALSVECWRPEIGLHQALKCPGRLSE